MFFIERLTIVYALISLFINAKFIELFILKTEMIKGCQFIYKDAYFYGV